MFLFVFIALFLISNSPSLAQVEDITFKPISEDSAFRATYRIQKFVNGIPSFFTEINEQYHPVLESSSIWLKIHKVASKPPEVRRFLYEGSSRKDVEITGLGYEHIPRNLFLNENGGSSSYEGDLNIEQNDLKLQPKLLPSNTSMTDVIFNEPYSSNLRLDLNLFVNEKCNQKINTKLHYIRGVSKLLNIIECRRSEFKIVDGEKIVTTRETLSKAYEANNLTAVSSNVNLVGKATTLDIKVNYRSQDIAQDSHASLNEIPARVLPMSISFSYTGGVMILINVFQFEMLSLSEHLSESSSSTSSFLLPLARGLGDLLSSDIQELPGRKYEQTFSFKAQLKGNRLPFKDPIEMLVVYDGPNQYLSRKSAIVDRSRSTADSWNKFESQVVYDGKSKMNFHIMNSNDGYRYSIFDDENASSGEDSRYWRSCASNSMTPYQIEALESGTGDLFNLEKANFMGMAIVRGMNCFVYERTIYSLPLWMGLGAAEHKQNDSLFNSQIFVTLYEAVKVVEPISDRNSPDQLSKKTNSGKLVRLVVSFVATPKGAGDDRKVDKVAKRFNFELYDFSWSLGSVEDMSELFDVGHECVTSKENSRHVDLELILSSQQVGSTDQPLTGIWSDDLIDFQQIAAHVLNKDFGITPIQQVDLHTTLTSTNLIEISTKVYELTREQYNVQFVGFAKDLARAYSFGVWSIGVSSISMDECIWRASHGLDPEQAQDAYTKTDDSPSTLLIMYCHSTLHCVIGDDSWRPMVKQKRVRIDSVVDFPLDKSDQNRCSIYSMVMVRDNAQEVSADRKHRLVDWLASKQEQFIDMPIKLDISNQKFEMKVNSMRVSNVFGGHYGFGFLDPIHGVGYAIPTAELNIEPVIVNNLAECSHYCLMDHSCSSYSTCLRLDSKIDCIMTRVNWTETTKINELVSVAKRKTLSPGLSNTPSSRIKVTLSQFDQMVEVPLRKSSLCTIRPSRHLDIFNLKDNGLNRVPDSKYLLSADSVNDCAEFCLNRAHLFRILEYTKRVQVLGHEEAKKFLDTKIESLDKKAGTACTAFRFSHKSRFCQLIPQLDIEYRLMSNPLLGNKSNELLPVSMKLLDKWRVASQELKKREKSLMVFVESEYYLLDYESLFIGHPDIHLMLNDVTNDKRNYHDESYLHYDSIELQSIIVGTKTHDCARECLALAGCRSFDILANRVEAENEKSFERVDFSCVLNVKSISDIIAEMNVNREHQLPMVVVKEYRSNLKDSKNNWIHYEPSELVLFLTGNLEHDYDQLVNSSYIDNESDVTGVEGRAESLISRQEMIYVNVSAGILSKLFTASIANENHDRANSKSTDTQPTRDGWINKNLSNILILMLTVAILVLLIFGAIRIGRSPFYLSESQTNLVNRWSDSLALIGNVKSRARNPSISSSM